MEILLHAIANEDLAAIKNEIEAVSNSLKIAKSYVKIIEKNNSNYNSLDEVLLEYQGITMLHYSGHSFEEGLNVTQDGFPKILGIGSLKTLISTHKRIRFVFLNSCYSEIIAQELINIGVPYVIGTKGKVGDKISAIVAKSFYYYLASGPKTITEAYLLAKEYFKNNQSSIDIEFRSLITDDDNEKNIWKLFPEDDSKLTPEQQEWTLIPKANLVLSDHENKDKIKFLCLYEKKYAEIVQLIRANLKGNYVFHGIWEISDAIESKSLKTEVDSADFIFHFTHGNQYEGFIQGINIEELIKKKKNIFLRLDGLTDFLEKFSWFNKLNLKDDGVSFIDLNLNSLTNKENYIQNSYLAWLDEVVENETMKTQISSEKVVEDLRKMSFYEEMTNFLKASTPQKNSMFFHTTISGTASDAQVLLVNKLRDKSGLSKNSHEKICFNCDSLQINSDTIDVLEIENRLWKQLAVEITKDSGDYDLSDTEKSKKRLIGKIIQKAKTMPLALIFDNISPQVKKLIDNQIYAKISSEKASIENKIWFFSVSYNGEKTSDIQNQNGEKTSDTRNQNGEKTSDNTQNQFEISISDFNEIEFDDWKQKAHNCSVLESFSAFKFENITNTKRKLVLGEICQHFVQDETKREFIIEKLLEHD